MIPIPNPLTPPRLDPPQSPETNRAGSLYLANRCGEALPLAFAALDESRTGITLYNVAVILESMARHEEALPYMREAYHAMPDDQRVQRGYGESLLRVGHLAEGWLLYSRGHDRLDWLREILPEWQGAHEPPRRLLVLEYGGYGDNIYFLRWLARLRAWGAQITYLCQPTFAPLVRSLGYRTLENWCGNIRPRLDFRDYDAFTSIHTLAAKLGVTFANHANDIPYIPGAREGNSAIAFCPAAGEARSPRRTRTLSPLQESRIRARIPDAMLLRDLSGSWLDTVSLLACVRLLVTVDTGLTHLAAAMGIPTLVILPGASAWQYPLGHTKHPLYPTMHLFHNRGEGMSRAVEEVCDYLPHAIA